jgi:hypothetical protein
MSLFGSQLVQRALHPELCSIQHAAVFTYGSCQLAK